ncbi:MAG: hypothetical protein ABJH28_04280 [Paraglaciecola sp.]|uniref:hypothetical protein n=1 Tax=Paraglaciecola sp. TaxID=1920173 RepID=UPI0032658B34
MSNTDYIINLCHDLQQQGKTPSVALVRSSASMPLPIPDVIKAIKYWKANPESRPSAAKIISQQKIPTSQSLEQRVSQLEQQLAQTIKEMTELKSKIRL